MQDVASCYCQAAQARVPVVSGFEHPSSNVRTMRCEKTFDVIAVDAKPAIETKHAADGLGPSQGAEADPADRRRTLKTAPLHSKPATEGPVRRECVFHG